jgi:hypothetical protein
LINSLSNRLQYLLKKALYPLVHWILAGIAAVVRPAKPLTNHQPLVVIHDPAVGIGDHLMISPMLPLLADQRPVIILSQWEKLLVTQLEWVVYGNWSNLRRIVMQYAKDGYGICIPRFGIRSLMLTLELAWLRVPMVAMVGPDRLYNSVSGTVLPLMSDHYSKQSMIVAQLLLSPTYKEATAPLLRLPPVAQCPADFDEKIFDQGIHVAMAPWAHATIRRWPLPHWVSLINLLCARDEKIHIHLFGTKSELPHGKTIQTQVNNPQWVVLHMGEFTLHETTYMISRCNLLVTNDNGLMHLALGVDTTVVALFGSTDHQQRLYGKNWSILQQPELCPTNQAPCHTPFIQNPDCPTQIECLSGISPKAVEASILPWLQSIRGSTTS